MSIFDKIFNINPHNKVPEGFSEEETTFEPRSSQEILDNQEKGREDVENLESIQK